MHFLYPVESHMPKNTLYIVACESIFGSSSSTASSSVLVSVAAVVKLWRLAKCQSLHKMIDDPVSVLTVALVATLLQFFCSFVLFFFA